ncbi:MAG: cytidylate kinase-like family protein [Magnetococcales bacterium]|nr:cytidylate kinase-like family protein [Magnetococcales bacterium]
MSDAIHFPATSPDFETASYPSPLIHQEISPPLVTVSGECQESIEEVGFALAETLGVNCFTQEMIEAEIEADISAEIFDAEPPPTFSGNLDQWLQTLVTADPASQPGFFPHLVDTVMTIAHSGGVIIGLGAHLILAGKRVFRLKVESGPEYCARHLAQRVGVSIKAARKMVERTDCARVQFVKEIYHRFPSQNTYYDLTLGTEILTSEQIVTITLETMSEVGIKGLHTLSDPLFV